MRASALPLSNPTWHQVTNFDTATAPFVIIDSQWGARRVQALEQCIERADLTRGQLVLFTSGTTNLPRGVVRHIVTWQGTAAQFADILELDRQATVLVPGPISMTTYSHAAWNAHACGAAVVTDPKHAGEATHVQCAPGLLLRFVAAKRSGDMPRLRVAGVAGDRVPDHYFDDCAAAGIRLVEYYGSAQLSAIGYRNAPTHFTPFDGVEVRSEDGVLWVRTPFAASRSLHVEDNDPWVRQGDWHSVGDRGLVSGQTFRPTGRAGHANTGGHTVNLADVEQFALSIPGVTHAVALALPHRKLGERLALWVAGSVTRADVRAAFKAVPAPSRPGPLRISEQPPFTDIGKVDRRVVATLFEAPDQ